MKNLLFAFMMLATVSAFAQSKTDVWNEFAKTKYEPRYLEKIGEYQFYPTFGYAAYRTVSGVTSVPSLQVCPPLDDL